MFFLTAVYTGYSGVESVLKLIGLIVLCVLIIAASFFVTRMIGRRETGISGNSNFRSLDIYRIAPNKFLQLIQAGSRYFVIAVGKDNVTLICELDKEEISFRNPPGTKVSFKDVLTRMTGRKDKTVPDSADDVPHSGVLDDALPSGGSDDISSADKEGSVNR